MNLAPKRLTRSIAESAPKKAQQTLSFSLARARTNSLFVQFTRGNGIMPVFERRPIRPLGKFLLRVEPKLWAKKGRGKSLGKRNRIKGFLFLLVTFICYPIRRCHVRIWVCAFVPVRIY